MVILIRSKSWKMLDFNQKVKMFWKNKLPIVKIRMFNIHKDIWSLEFQLIVEIIHIHFNIVLTFEIEPKQGNVEIVNRFKKWFISWKERLFSRKLRCPNKENVDKFQIYNKIYNKIRRAAKKLYYDKQFKKFTKDSKQTWSLIREVIGEKTDKHKIPKFFQSNS